MGSFKSKNKEEKEEDKIIFEEQSDLIKEENRLYKEIDQLFHQHDKDNDLTLDKEEFEGAYFEYMQKTANSDPLSSRMKMFYEQMEIPKKKKFNKEEFRIVMSSVVLEDFTMNEMIDLFKTFDKKKDGKICTQEIMHIFKNLGLDISQEAACKLISEASYGDNEEIDFEEFARAILAK